MEVVPPIVFAVIAVVVTVIAVVVTVVEILREGFSTVALPVVPLGAAVVEAMVAMMAGAMMAPMMTGMVV